MKSTAIFGGSFNPIHLGHLAIARAVIAQTDAEKVIFLPNANPPHKIGQALENAKHRYNMVRLAIEGDDSFGISAYEMTQEKPSYTIDTIRYMKDRGIDKPWFIIGADSLYTIDKWRKYKELIEECNFIVADRNCREGDDIHEGIAFVQALGGNVKLINMPKIDITSTMIRAMIANGRDASAYIPKKVLDYIKKYDLYQSSPEG